MFKPLIDALFDAVPVAWDMYSNFIYRLVTGRKFEDNIEVLEGDIMEVENIVKYEYIPTEEIKDMSKENDNYITSSGYYKRHPEDKLLERKILIDNLPDKERMDIFETILICQDKAENPKNVNYNLGQWCTHFYRGGWNKGFPGYNKGKHLSEETKRKLSEQRKGKSFEERFGKERAEEIKRKIS